eukprot:GEZU01025824.1.p1 GENE.GEZU01025824.1~~GEZU01025824.1.p1  ORF type:complete len:104 (-),score=11.44 GEZU01025824.1:57-368(-)
MVLKPVCACYCCNSKNCEAIEDSLTFVDTCSQCNDTFCDPFFAKGLCGRDIGIPRCTSRTDIFESVSVFLFIGVATLMFAFGVIKAIPCAPMKKFNKRYFSYG